MINNSIADPGTPAHRIMGFPSYSQSRERDKERDRERERGRFLTQ